MRPPPDARSPRSAGAPTRPWRRRPTLAHGMCHLPPRLQRDWRNRAWHVGCQRRGMRTLGLLLLGTLLSLATAGCGDVVVGGGAETSSDPTETPQHDELQVLDLT